MASLGNRTDWVDGLAKLAVFLLAAASLRGQVFPPSTGASGSGTIASTTSVLKGDGAGAAVAASASDIPTLTSAKISDFSTSQSGALIGDVTKSAGSGSTTVTALNGTSLAGLATGIVKNTTATGVPSIITAPTGAIVGTSDTQTLSGKSIDAGQLTGAIVADRMPALTGDVTTTVGTIATTVAKINGVALSGLATGILKNTTTSGVPSIATSGTDYTAPVASGTATLGTSAIGSGACATVVTVAGSGIATTDIIQVGFNGDPTGVTGYAPSANGGLAIISYPTSGNANFKACNDTSASITPGAITLNWRVAR